ncbi:HlyD family secretion protein [Caulobacter sp. S45]|uniref:HlyD family secretion protein n=1 Tax=Caulobacter sp. S45 TaxID=1641861 RepID=UPI001576D4D5|nr:HlyD family secretion protein [Caulobacter sp. S45]
MSYVEEGAAAVQGEAEPGAGAADPSSGALRTSTRLRAQGWRLPLLILAPVLILLLALYLYLNGGRYAATDDAYVQSARATVASNVPGQVVEIDVRENQFVHAGDVLFRLDPRPFDVAAEQSQAELASAQQNIQASQASYAQRGAEIEAAQSALLYANKELVRQQAMAASGVSSQSQLDAAAQAVANDKAQLAAARQQQANILASLGGQANGPLAQNASVRTAQAAVDRAKLNQAYGVVRALQDGVVTKVEQLQVGDFVNAGQALFTLAAPRLWVEANFKEDQLAYMRPGQPGTVKIDAYPAQTYRVHVASLSPGTGNSFSVLPAENATGNWVKVVQRLPVRLVFDDDTADIRAPLAAGLSAKVTVDTAHQRKLFGYGLNHRAVR